MPTNIVLKNPSATHTLRVRPQDARYDEKTKKKTTDWKPVAVDAFISPGGTLDIWVGADRRIVVEEMPT